MDSKENGENSSTPAKKELPKDEVPLKKYIMWENKSNICWLDASMALIAHNKVMKKYSQISPTSRINKIISTYEEAISILNDPDKSFNQRIILSRAKLNDVQDAILQYLQPRLKYKTGDPESAFCSLYNLLIQDPTIKSIFDVTWMSAKECTNCEYQATNTIKKPIITFSKIDSFDPKNPCGLFQCVCNRSGQKMKLTYVTLPPCLIFHFENGAGKEQPPMSFTIQGRDYDLTGIMTLEKAKESNVNHFITWIRDPSTDMWLDCNDLNLDIILFTPNFPDINLQDVYMYVYECYDDLGVITIDKVLDIKTTDENIICIDIFESDESDSENNRAKSGLAKNTDKTEKQAESPLCNNMSSKEPDNENKSQEPMESANNRPTDVLNKNKPVSNLKEVLKTEIHTDKKELTNVSSEIIPPKTVSGNNNKLKTILNKIHRNDEELANVNNQIIPPKTTVSGDNNKLKTVLSKIHRNNEELTDVDNQIIPPKTTVSDDNKLKTVLNKIHRNNEELTNVNNQIIPPKTTVSDNNKLKTVLSKIHRNNEELTDVDNQIIPPKTSIVSDNSKLKTVLNKIDRDKEELTNVSSLEIPPETTASGDGSKSKVSLSKDLRNNEELTNVNSKIIPPKTTVNGENKKLKAVLSKTLEKPLADNDSYMKEVHETIHQSNEGEQNKVKLIRNPQYNEKLSLRKNKVFVFSNKPKNAGKECKVGSTAVENKSFLNKKDQDCSQTLSQKLEKKLESFQDSFVCTDTLSEKTPKLKNLAHIPSQDIISTKCSDVKNRSEPLSRNFNSEQNDDKELSLNSGTEEQNYTESFLSRATAISSETSYVKLSLRRNKNPGLNRYKNISVKSVSHPIPDKHFYNKTIPSCSKFSKRTREIKEEIDEASDYIPPEIPKKKQKIRNLLEMQKDAQKARDMNILCKTKPSFKSDSKSLKNKRKISNTNDNSSSGYVKVKKNSDQHFFPEQSTVVAEIHAVPETENPKTNFEKDAIVLKGFEDNWSCHKPGCDCEYKKFEEIVDTVVDFSFAYLSKLKQEFAKIKSH